MSLVVAKSGNNRIHIFSDSKVTDKYAIKRGYLHGALKTVIINEYLCVSFAGAVGFGQSAIKKIAWEKYNIDQLCDYLLNIHNQSKGETDFLVATLTPNSLYKIASGKIDNPESSCWIGDHDAFAKFQQYSHTSNITTSVNSDSEYWVSLAKAGLAMQQVIDDPKVPSVDELLVHVASMDGKFEYMGYGRMISSRPQIIPASPLGEWHTLRVGGAAEGGFTYQILTPIKAGVGAMCVHFSQGNLGALFYPAKYDKPIVFSNTSIQQLIIKIKEQYDIDFKV